MELRASTIRKLLGTHLLLILNMTKIKIVDEIQLEIQEGI